MAFVALLYLVSSHVEDVSPEDGRHVPVETPEDLVQVRVGRVENAADAAATPLLIEVYTQCLIGGI